ncbi:MAG: L,D-transpeptidase [Gaiellaceae bacterium]
MAREVWPLAALPVALAALAASLALRPPVRQESGAQPAVVAHSPRADSVPRVARVQPRSAPKPGSLVARVVSGARVTVHSVAGGPVSKVLGDRTEFGSPRALGVVRRRGRWLGVTLPELPEGRLGWVDSRAHALRLAATRIALEVDLSSHTLALRRGDRLLRRVRVTIGAAGSTTPTGRFAITDKLSGPRFSAAYGCCILALSGRQPNLPAGWSGGDRLAIHGAPAGEPVGSASSAGCLHAPEEDLRALMQTVPLGAPVVIRA